MQRLDEVIGGEWSDQYTKAPSGGLECALTVCGITRRDVGDDQNDNEQEKAGYSDAFKRAAVKFGIGRFLYSLPKMFAEVKPMGKSFVLADGEQARLEKIITAALNGQPQPEQRKPAPAPTREVKQEGEAIPAAEWDKFTALIERAEKAGVKHPPYVRAEMDLHRVNGASKYLEFELEKTVKKEGK
jgi:hypothetical protein